MRRRKKAGKKNEQAQEEPKRFDWKRSTLVQVLLVFVALFIALLIYVTLQPVPEPETTSYEEPLMPLVSLSMYPGERYTYELRSLGDDFLVIENEVYEKRPECTIIMTISGNFSFPFCIDEKTGESITSTEYGSQPGPSPEFIQPWMLSLDDNWTWSVGSNTTVEMFGMRETMQGTSRYRMVARGVFKGRNAFKVLVETGIARLSGGERYESTNYTELIWVDAEKRVMLYATSRGSVMELVEAPFPVERHSE